MLLTGAPTAWPALAILPLPLTHATLVLGFHQPRRFDSDDDAAFGLLAVLLGQAEARSYESWLGVAREDAHGQTVRALEGDAAFAALKPAIESRRAT